MSAVCQSLSAEVVLYADIRGELGGERGMKRFPSTIETFVDGSSVGSGGRSDDVDSAMGPGGWVQRERSGRGFVVNRLSIGLQSQCGVEHG